MTKRAWGLKKVCAATLPVLVIWLAVSVLGAVAAASGTIRNAILISWDGVQRDHLRELLDAGKLPNLKALIEEGTIVEIDVTHKTDTKAGHAQMLTGYGPEVTGVYSNSVYQPIPKGYTVFERLEEEFGPDNIATIMITGKAQNLGSRGPAPGEVLSSNTLRQRLASNGVSRREVLERLKEVFGEDKVGRAIISIIAEASSDVTRKWPSRLLKSAGEPTVNRRVAAQSQPGEPFYNAKPMIDIFHGDKARPAPDAAGHRYGENSQQYSDAIIAVDKWLGRIVDKLKELGVYEETRIYVTSDHGFDEGKTAHSMAPYVFLATNDSEIKRRGDQRDIAPTILVRMGVDISKFNPPLLGRLLTDPERSW